MRQPEGRAGMIPERRTLAGRHDLLALAAAHSHRYPALLESVAHGTAQARYDVLFAFPESELRLDHDGRVRDGDDAVVAGLFLDVLDTHWRRSSTSRARASSELPFEGGWLLYFGYELAGQIEPRLQPMRRSASPVALALRCPAALIVDHASNTTILVAEAGCTPLLAQMQADLHDAPALVEVAPCVRRVDEDDPRRFLDGVARTQEHLRAGDVFQVNLSREWRVELAEAMSPALLHAALRRANPSPFAGLLQWRGFAFASSSPERLVETRGALAQTRPIAGTRARVDGDDAEARIRELISHPKERAEHVMLIDLERNDLGRVCVPGSIEVDELMVVESYAHVHHIVSNVRGRLRADVTPGEVIRAVFPGGTITGCPKVRCMEIIAGLEQCARGVYTGSLGYLGTNGDLDLNILIRTLVLQDRTISLRAGAGIVVDSDPEAELAETRAKARGLLRALGVEA